MAVPPPPPPGSYAAPPPPPPPGGYGAPAYGWAPVPPGMYHDPVSGQLLPQGVVLASVGRRIGAWFLSIGLAIVTLGIGYIIWGVIVWGRGQTPALQVLGCRCWRPDDQRPAGFWWMALRETVGRLADSIIGFITLIVSFVLFVNNPDHKSIHDHVAGTLVLYDPNHVLG